MKIKYRKEMINQFHTLTLCGNQNRTQIGVLFILSSNLHVTENMISKNVAVKYKTDISATRRSIL